MSRSDPLAEALVRARWQSTLFAAPRRAELAQLLPQWDCRRVRVAVHRNHAIEPVTSVAAPYAAWNRIEYEWKLGPYDDSLSFAAPVDAEVHLVWLDTSRLEGLQRDDMGAWLRDRLLALRALTRRPIVVAAWPLSAAAKSVLASTAIGDLHVVDLDPFAADLGERWLELRTQALSGTRLSNRACMVVAAELACRWLPAAVLPPIKCVALDLDGTLYEGVLGEDGIAALKLDEGHRRLQQFVAGLREAGVLLAILSRNDRADVVALFEARTDFPLRLEHFSAIEVSWDDKADALGRIAGRLRIGSDAIAVVDDNPGELVAMAATGAVTVHARAAADETRAALSHVAGMWRWRASSEDRLRAHDLRASEVRDSLRATMVDPDEYLRSLDMRLDFFVGASEHLARMADLARKTNQFNLSLRRSSETELAARMREHAGNVIAIGLADRLSDSGIVAVVSGQCRDGTLEVEEVAVSCRALGRRVEDGMLAYALMLMAEGRSVTRVCLRVARGPRNMPAREWLSRHAGCAIGDEMDVVCVPHPGAADTRLAGAVRIAVHQCEAVQ